MSTSLPSLFPLIMSGVCDRSGLRGAYQPKRFSSLWTCVRAWAIYGPGDTGLRPLSGPPNGRPTVRPTKNIPYNISPHPLSLMFFKTLLTPCPASLSTWAFSAAVPTIFTQDHPC